MRQASPSRGPAKPITTTIAFRVAITVIAASSVITLSSLGHAKDVQLVKPEATSSPTCCGQDPNKPHLLAASYYSVADGLAATLMLNNKGPQSIEVKPTLYSLTGERLEVDAVVVPGESFRNIDLRDFGATPGTLFEEGSIQLFHRGPDLVIGAQLYLVDEQHSLSFDEKLAEFENAAATQLEAVWWLPSRNSNVSLVLSNTSSTDVTVEGIINAGTPHPKETSLTLAAHETRVIKVERKSAGLGGGNDVGAASLHHSGAKGSLLARALIQDADSGYSMSAQFYSPQGNRSSAYQGVGLRLNTTQSDVLTPIVVARNVGDVETYLTGRMPYTTVDGSSGVVQLQKVKLAAGEAANIDVERAIRQTVRPQHIATASLEFEYSTPPGSVMMAAQSVSANGNQVFRVPMWDVPAQRNGTGGYPWFIDGSSSTFVYIKNVTGTDQNFTFSLTYEGGDYSTGVRSVKPGETVAFDIRALRDNQVPDERGQTIPLSATRGKIVWSVRGRNPLGLLGRSEQVDPVKGISSSYACFMCCSNSFRNSWIEPFSFSLPVGDARTVRGKEQDQTCYGSLTTAYYWGDTWTVDNTNVITIDGSGDSADVSAVDSGAANVVGHWEVYYFSSQHDLNGPYCEESSDQTEPNAPITVPPRIIGLNDIWYFAGLTPAFYPTTQTLNATPTGAGSYQWSIVQGSDHARFTGGVSTIVTSTNTVDLIPTGKSISTRDVGVRVTVNGVTSPTFGITIHALDRLVLGLIEDISSGDRGFASHINYAVKDQFGSAPPYNVELNEIFPSSDVNDYTPMNWGRPTAGSTTLLAGQGLFFDNLSGPLISAFPSPVPVPPGSPLSGTKIVHLDQQWRVGSSTSGVGYPAQFDTIQFYLDHGRHFNVVSPVP